MKNRSLPPSNPQKPSVLIAGKQTLESVATADNEIGFYRAKQASGLLGVAPSTWWLWVQQKAVRGVSVPQPIRLSAGVTVWKKNEIHAFYNQLAALDDLPTPPEAA